MRLSGFFEILHIYVTKTSLMGRYCEFRFLHSIQISAVSCRTMAFRTPSPGAFIFPTIILVVLSTPAFASLITPSGRITSPATKSLRSISWFLPTKGDNIKDEIKCYGLPYGGIGFTSHVLTYYTIALLSAGRSPWTWGKNKHWRFDVGLAALALLATTATTIITLVKCRNRWQFICIACWKLCMSLCLTLLGLHSALIVRRRRRKVEAGVEEEAEAEAKESSSPTHKRKKTYKEGRPGNWAERVANRGLGRRNSDEIMNQPPASEDSESAVLGWIAVYVPGLIAGLVGLLSVVKQNWALSGLKEVTMHFSSVGLAIVSTIMVMWLSSELERLNRKRHQDIFRQLFSDRPPNPPKMSRVPPEDLLGSLGGSVTRPPATSATATSVTAADTDTDIGIANSVREDVTKTEGQQRMTRFLRRVGLTRTRQRAAQSFFQGMEEILFSRTVRRQYDSGRRLGLGPWRLLFRIFLFLVGGAVTTAGVLAVLYSDFALGVVAANMTGWPSSDNAVFYWIYFIAKRLPLLSA